jgi:hypothetical protein
LNSRYSQVEYLLESAKFKGKDARTESEYDEMSESGSEYESDEEYDGISEHETSPEPVNSVDSP